MSTKKRKKIYTAIILDKSGSMSGTERETVTSYNEQIQQQKLNAKDADMFCSLVTFNGDVFEHLWNVKAEDLPAATVESYKPDGSTAMRDAVGHTVKKLLDTTDKDDPDTAYLVCIISDGQENASRHFGVQELKEIIESCQKTKRWTFTYMGCSDAYLKVIAQQTSIPISNMASWDHSSMAKTRRAYSCSNLATANYYSAVIANDQMAVENCMFSNDATKSADFADLSTPLQGGVVIPTQKGTLSAITAPTTTTNAQNVFLTGTTVAWKAAKKPKAK